MSKLKRNKIFKVRLSFAEQSLIKRKSRDSGMTASRFVREAALGIDIQPRQFTDEEKQLYKTMVGVANNLNQLTKKYNQGDRMFLELQKVLADTQTLIDKLLSHVREN